MPICEIKFPFLLSKKIFICQNNPTDNHMNLITKMMGIYLLF